MASLKDLLVSGAAKLLSTLRVSGDTHIDGTLYLNGAIGGTKQPVYVDSTGKFVAGTSFSNVTNYDLSVAIKEITRTANATTYTLKTIAGATSTVATPVATGTANRLAIYTDAHNVGLSTISFASETLTVPGAVVPSTTNARTLGTSSSRWSKLYLGTADNYGSAYVPIWWNAGVPTAVTANSMLTNLGSTTGVSVFQQNPRPGVTGTLGVGNGGTGKTSWTQWGVLYASASNTLANTAAGTTGKYLGAITNGAPVWKDILANEIHPSISKTYTPADSYGTADSDAACSFYFISVKPDSWYKPWLIRFRVRSYCASHANADSVTWTTLNGRADDMIYHNWNERYDTGHYYLAVRRLKSAGFSAGLGHAVGISVRYATGRGNTEYNRTIELDYYDCYGCTVTVLDAATLWSGWTNGTDANYNGYTNYDAVNRGLRESSDDNDTTTLTSYYDRITAGANGLMLYSLAMLDSTGNWQSFTTNNGTGTSKTKNTAGFILGDIVYLSTGSNITNGNIVGWGVVRRYQGLIDYRYSFNCGTGLTANKMVYIVGSIGTDGLFYLADTWWTQTLPTSEDGKLYIPVGIPYPDSGPYRGDFSGWHTPLQYLNGCIRSFLEPYISTVLTFQRGLEVTGHIAGDSGTTGHGLYSGGGYHNAYNNIILHGDASTGSSGIAFVSDKAANGKTITSINLPSDRAFIQYHACGVSTYTAEGTAPTLATSGETGRLIIGVGNDAGDLIHLLAPSHTDLLHRIGASAYVIPDTNNTSGTVGSTTQPVYVNGGIITATSYALNATINSSTTNYMAYYSGANAISGTSYAQMIDGCLNLYPANGNYREGIRIHPYGGWADITLMGNTNTNTSGIAATDWFIGNNSGVLYIAHNGSSSSSTGYLKASTENSAGYWLLYQRVGINGASTGYNFYVNGTSYFNGNATHNGIVYFANDTTYYINNSGTANLNALTLASTATFNGAAKFNAHMNWKANTNFYCDGVTANGLEWSFDLTPGTYTGTYWHVWSAKNSKTILGCYTDDNKVTIPNGGLQLQSIIANEGTAAVAVDNGSSSSNRYQPTRWTFNLGIPASRLVSGLVVIIKMPSAGHDYGVFLSVDNGTTYKPISSNTGTNRLTTHYGNGTVLILCYDASGQTNSVFPVNGSTSRTNITGGCWRPVSSYDDGNPGDWNLRLYILKALTAITAIHIIGGTDNGYNMVDAGTAFDIRYAVLYAGSAISAGGTGSNNYIHHYAVNIRNSSDSYISVTAYKNLYIKGTISGNMFTPISGGNPFVLDITAADDGYVYYYIGRSYATNAFTFDATALAIYWYKDGAIRPYNHHAMRSKAACITTTANAVAYYTDTAGTFGTKASANGALYATSANGALNWGTLPVGQGGTGATTLTSGAVLLGNGTSAIQTRTLTNNTSNTAIANNTNIPTMNTIYYGLVTVNNASLTRATGIYAPTSAGTSGYYLKSAGGTSAPTWAELNKSAVGLGNVTNDALIPKSIGTAKGDMIYWSAASTPARLAIGSNGQFLTISNGVPAWASITVDGYVPLSGGTMTGLLTHKGIAGTLNIDYGETLPSSPSVGLIFFLYGPNALHELPAGGPATYVLVKNSIADYDVKWSALFTNNQSTKFYVAGPTTTSASGVGIFNTNVYVLNNVLYGAAWNDYAEYRERKGKYVSPGRCVVENGDGSLSQSTKRLQPGAEIVSDTYGFAIGKTNKCKMPIAVSGRVLAYPYEDINTYKVGAPVCSGPNGTISLMSDEEARLYPWLIIGTVSSIPTEETWGANNIRINGRIWIRVK